MASNVMFNNLTKSTILIFMALGWAIVLVMAVFSQLEISNSLSHLTFFEIAKYNLISSNWWYIIGVPATLVIAFILITYKLSMVNLESKQSKSLILAALALSFVSIPFAMFAGIILAFVSALSLIIHLIYVKNHNNSLKPGTPQSGAP